MHNITQQEWHIITYGSGANFNSRVTKCKSVHSLTITGTQTLGGALGLQII